MICFFVFENYEKEKCNSMDRVVVYGTGKFFQDYKQNISGQFEIADYVDKSGKMGERNIAARIQDVSAEYDKVLVMVSKIGPCFEIIRQLLDNGIKNDEIILGFHLWGEYSKFSDAYVTEHGKIQLVKDNIRVLVSTEDEFHNVAEVLVLECYKYHLDGNVPEVVFDVGMNIGDATLYFLEQEKVKKVYAFEPFYETYCRAMENLKRYENSERLEVFQYGLSNINVRKELIFNPEMSCGQSTLADINDIAVSNYIDWGLFKPEESRKEIIEIRRSSEVFSKLMAENPFAKFILKLDCEGEEYGIFDDLAKSGLLKKFSFIMLEWHYKSDKPLIDILKENGFSYFSMQKCVVPAMGLIYAWVESK